MNGKALSPVTFISLEPVNTTKYSETPVADGVEKKGPLLQGKVEYKCIVVSKEKSKQSSLNKMYESALCVAEETAMQEQDGCDSDEWD